MLEAVEEIVEELVPEVPEVLLFMMVVENADAGTTVSALYVEKIIHNFLPPSVIYLLDCCSYWRYPSRYSGSPIFASSWSWRIVIAIDEPECPTCIFRWTDSTTISPRLNINPCPAGGS